jgi:plasmid maintenance system antidote protein VapI
MLLASYPGRLLKRELKARELSANRLALDLGVPSGRITDILNGVGCATGPLFWKPCTVLA